MTIQTPLPLSLRTPSSGKTQEVSFAVHDLETELKEGILLVLRKNYKQDEYVDCKVESLTFENNGKDKVVLITAAITDKSVIESGDEYLNFADTQCSSLIAAIKKTAVQTLEKGLALQRKGLKLKSLQLKSHSLKIIVEVKI